MSSQLSLSSKKSSVFCPKQLTPVTLERTTVYLYPTINASMNENERTYGLTVTKNALISATSVSFKTKLECLKQHTGSTSTVEVISSRFMHHARNQIHDVNKVTLQSYHSSDGRVITDCTKPGSDHLKDMDNQTDDMRRPIDIRFARVSTNLEFKSLDPNHITRYPFSYFIDLPITSSSVTSAGGNSHIDLKTFAGRGDWLHGSQTRFLEVVHRTDSVGQPFLLKAPEIDGDAIMNIAAAVNRLDEIALEAAWDTITDTIHKELCPLAISDPVIALQNLRHNIVDESTGTMTSRSVHEYYSSIKQITDFFPKTGTWPIDVVQHFLSHLDDEIRIQVQKDFKYDSTCSNKDAYSQSAKLLEALRHATTAEEQKDSLNTKISQHIRGTQALQSSVHISVAEDTIRKYIESPIPRKIERRCWGCGDTTHLFMENGIVVCPNKEMPGVAAKAKAVHIDFNQRRKEARKRRKTELKDSKKQKAEDSEKMETILTDIRSFLVQQQKPSDNPVQDIVLAVSVLSVIGPKPPLPIGHDPALPHINFSVGKSDKQSFKISLAFDSCAVLNVGFLPYHLAIAKACPSVVKSITWAKKDYAPLVLSGIVNNKESGDTSNTPSTTTLLPATIEYHTPYLTKDDTPITLKIALGNQVGVNTILGLSTIKNAKMSLDLDANVVQSGVIKGSPFQLSFKPTSRGIPNVNQLASHPEINHLQVNHSIDITLTDPQNENDSLAINVNTTESSNPSLLNKTVRFADNDNIMKSTFW